MSRIQSRREKRSAFTLVELMVVVLIIAILVSLVSAAVAKVMIKIPETQTATEISQMDQALAAFMSTYNLSTPPPSVLYLNETSPLSTQSGPFLTRVFGKNLGPTDWNGDGTIQPANVTWTLEGEQCLVFYLGGIPNTGSMQCLGFSTNNMNPAAPGGRRNGPFMTFVTPRLVTGNGGFFMYVDPWQSKASPFYTTYGGTPYAFFSSQGITNNYSSDCPTIDAAGPYVTGTAYTNSNTYQIISAGRDGNFGGGNWNPSNGATGAGADDQTNFSSKLLGVGQQ